MQTLCIAVSSPARTAWRPSPAARRLAENKPAAAASSSTAPLFSLRVVAPAYVNVRAEPSTVARVFALRFEGDVVEADAERDGWVRCAEPYGSALGWMLIDGKALGLGLLLGGALGLRRLQWRLDGQDAGPVARRFGCGSGYHHDQPRGG